MSGLRAWLREHGAGRLAYRLLHRPRAQIDLARTYGWRLVWRAASGDRAMRRAACQLLPPPAQERALAAPICFLTGPRFIHQTLFCAHSFARRAAVSAHCEFLSDGRLDAENIGALRRVFPQATVRPAAELDQLVAQELPPERFPALHAVRKTFVLLRKLTDAMAGRSGYRLLFDSDMLFWSAPSELLTRAAASEPLYLADTVDDGYTTTRAALTRTLGVPVARGVNSGLVGLDAGRIDWNLMERGCAFLRTQAGDQRLLEQTLWAVALGAGDARPLAPDSYRVVVDPPHWQRARAQSPAPALLHYAWQARLPYAAGEWRRYLQECAA